MFLDCSHCLRDSCTTTIALLKQNIELNKTEIRKERKVNKKKKEKKQEEKKTRRKRKTVSFSNFVTQQKKIINAKRKYSNKFNPDLSHIVVSVIIIKISSNLILAFLEIVSKPSRDQVLGELNMRF